MSLAASGRKLSRQKLVQMLHLSPFVRNLKEKFEECYVAPTCEMKLKFKKGQVGGGFDLVTPNVQAACRKCGVEDEDSE